MWKYSSRLFIAVWFVTMVVVAMRGMPAQGQSEGGEPKQYFPTMLRNAPPAVNPELHGYIGVGANGDIYTLRADGSDLRNLTLTSTGIASHPRFSPDGSRIAFFLTDGATRAMVMNRDGSALYPLLTHEFADTPQLEWSPTGRHLLVWGSRAAAPSQTDLFLVALDGSEPTHLVESNARVGFWGWSPDGQFVHYRRGDGLWLYTMKSGGEVRISSTEILARVVWHPNSDSLFFEEWIGNTPMGRMVSTEATTSTLLFTGDYRFQGWVKGDEALLLWNPEAPPFLYTISRYGGEPEPLFPDSTASGLHIVGVAPDGHAIVYTASSPTMRETYVYTFATGTQQLLWNQQTTVTRVTWAYNNSGLIFITSDSSNRAEISAGYYRSFGENGGQLRELFGGYPYFSSWSAQYLPLSSRYALAQYVSGYPPPHRQEYQLMLDSGSVSDSSTPFAPEVPFIVEWRYLP